MNPTVYTVVLADGQTFLLEADFAQAASPIRCCFFPDDLDEQGEGAWNPTPYQVADVAHSPTAAAEVCAEYFRR